MTASPKGFSHVGLDVGRHRIAGWADLLLDLVFPSRCAGCGRPGRVWCSGCSSRLGRIQGRLCERCGIPGHTQTSCRQPFAFPVRSFARYRGPLVRALLHMKYRLNRELADVMGSWLAWIVEREAWLPTLIVPVPLGPDRHWQRGYNQAGLIAASLAAKLDLPSSEVALIRIRETRSQVGLDGAARQRNVAGAFQAQAEFLGSSLVCLVDDLCTTGATLMACGEAGLQARARGVYGLTVGQAG